MGAALCAGAGVGVFTDLAETAQAAPLAATVVAERADVATMLQVYGRWKGRSELRPAADGDAVGALTTAMLAAGEAAGVAREKKLTPSLLVTAQFDEDSLARLARLGELEYSDFRSSMRLLTGPALVDALGDHDVFVTEVDLVDAAVLRDTPGLRVVVSCRNDPVNIDLDACSAFGVPVLNAPGRNAVAVADLAVSFMLSLARRSAAGGDFLRQPGSVAGDMGRMGQAFNLFRGVELWNMTVGLVGLGAVGREVARRLRGFGCRVLVSDPAVDAREAARHDAELLGLDELLERSDVVSLHAAVNDQTRGMINAERLAAMKPGAMLINTARAALVDEEALVEALRDGRLGGAGLDVFAEEPPASDHPLLAMANVIATPHLGGNTAEIAVHQGRIIADELELMAAGEVPRHCLNPEVLADFDWSADRREPGDEEIAGLLAKAGPAVSDLQSEKPGADDAAVEEDGKAADLSPVAADLREGMSRQLEAWGRAVSASEELAAEAENNQVTMQFELRDLALTFYLQLAADGASAGLGAIAGGADVRLSMGAAIFDGMFGGELNAMEAAMDGRLSFTGDAGKAMTLQHLEPLLAATYKAAREEAGDLGDLSALAASTTAEDGRSHGSGTAGPGAGGNAGSGAWGGGPPGAVRGGGRALRERPDHGHRRQCDHQGERGCR
jgi:autoinducer 2 (AI-2) kinase